MISGTGKIKPYVDKKHFFQELKNPPKKALNDLASESLPQEPPLFSANFDQSASGPNSFNAPDFTTDPFQDDPFEVDLFVETDPFETEPSNEFRSFNKDLDKTKHHKLEKPASMFTGNLSKSPKSSILEKQISMLSTSPRTVQFSKQNTFDAHFDKYEDKKLNKFLQLRENPSLDLSSESECAPEPPPRPTNNLSQIKPPPLPPKKQLGDISMKPPPRPPHTDDSHYDYMDHYETAPNSLEFMKNLESSPPLPVPSRKSKFESDFTAVPERPKKQFNLSAEEDYLTPVSFIAKKKDHVARHTGPLLLPPPQKSNRRHDTQATVASLIESKSTVTTSAPTEKTLESLDITLSQLTLSGLNELASKLDIPANQLSNMTLVQLTSYLSNFIKNKPVESETTFRADFAANFNNLNINSSETYDRYAVFRELIQEEIKQTKIDSEPEEITEEDEKLNNLDAQRTNENNDVVDKYAALREIVEKEMKQNQSTKDDEEDTNENELTERNNLDVKIENETNIMNTEKNLNDTEAEIIKDTVIEYNHNNKETETAVKSPSKPVKSPVPVALSEVQNNSRLNSGSLSDVVSGSSPEVDNTGSTSEVAKKSTDATGSCERIHFSFMLSL